MDEKPVVLIVDDTPENLRVLGGILEQEGFEVMVAINGQDALDNARAIPAPDLILLDIMMPNMDGYEVCRRLKSSDATRDIPIVFLTAMTSTDDEARGLELGAVDYITKPFKMELVKARVINHISHRQARIELQRYTTRLEEMVLERTKQLVEANARLASLDSAKNDFLHSISHDLRTPANGVLMVGQWAINSIEDCVKRQEIQAIFDSIRDRMIETLNNSLQLAEINVGNTPSILERIDLDKIFLATRERVRELAEQKSLAFTVSGVPPTTALGNEKLFQQALTTVFLALITLASPGTNLVIDYIEGEDRVRMNINAQAKPLAEEEIEGFFESFSRARASSHVQALGLALPLSAKIIMSMGGRIDICNSDKGVQFVITTKKHA